TRPGSGQVGVRPGGRRRPGPAPVRLLPRGRAMSSARSHDDLGAPGESQRGMADTTVMAESTVMADRPGAAATGAESILAGVLAGVLRVDRVSVDSDFFEELGADS